MAEQYKEKFIAFLDILGYSKLVEASETGSGLPAEELLELAAMLGTPHGGRSVVDGGRTICPHSPSLSDGLDFQVTQVTDCAVVSAEISPAGAINLVHHCWTAVLGLLLNGLLCRGYITQGKIIHRGSTVMGTGYQRAVVGEKGVSVFKRTAEERGTPFVEIDRPITDYVGIHGDWCAKTVFERFAKTTEDGVVIYPFQRLAHNFSYGPGYPGFKPEEHFKSNDNVRKVIGTLKQRVMAFADAKDDKAMQKVEHYIRALDAQLAVCDQTDKSIELLAGLTGTRKDRA